MSMTLKWFCLIVIKILFSLSWVAMFLSLFPFFSIPPKKGIYHISFMIFFLLLYPAFMGVDYLWLVVWRTWGKFRTYVTSYICQNMDAMFISPFNWLRFVIAEVGPGNGFPELYTFLTIPITFFFIVNN